MANINKRGNTYRIRVFVGTDENGKKIIKTTTYVPPRGTTPKKAQRLADEYAYEFERHCKGYTELNENMTFAELADWYFTHYATFELKASTYYTYMGQYNNHIKPKLGHLRLKNITTPKLTQVVQEFDLNPASVRKVYIIIQSIFRRAVQQGFIRSNPCHDVILPKEKFKTKVMSLNEEELSRFVKLLDEKSWDKDLKRIFKFLLMTGMRSGECFALRWEDIDFENKTISIKHTLNDIGGRHELTLPKTQHSIRMIGMSDTTESILREQYAYVEELKLALGDKFAHPEMVFPSGKGNYRDRNSVLTSFKRFLKGTEFEHMTLHKLRHCNATMLLNSGVDIKVVADHLGHCDVGVTANVYADVLKSTKAKVADLIALKFA
ncbi:MAG: site-specific integrase [Ruminococcus sp.]|nr:site-specific integrase [Ruminococcus sp.]